MLMLGGCSPDEAPPAPPAPGCGNGIVEDDEDCDLGFANDPATACTPACAVPACGDGFLAPDEACEPGDVQPECDVDCTIPTDRVWLDGWGGGAFVADEALAVVVDDTATVRTVGTIRDTAEATGWIQAHGPDGVRGWGTTFPAVLCSATRAVELVALPDGTAFVSRLECGGSPRVVVDRLEPDGTPGWSASFPAPVGGDPTRASLALADADRVALFYLVAGDVLERRLVELSVADGSILSEADITESLVDLAARPGGGTVAVTSESLLAYDAAAVLLWERSVRSWQAFVALAPDGDIVVARNSKDEGPLGPRLDRFDPAGEPRWSVELTLGRVDGEEVVPRPVSALAIDGSGNAIVGGIAPARAGQPTDDTRAAAVAHDPTGALVWATVHDGPAHHADETMGVAPIEGSDVIMVGRNAAPLAGDDIFVARHHPTGTAFATVAPTSRAVEAPPPRSRAADGPRPDTVFVDFGGGHLSPGDDSAQDQASCVSTPFDFPAHLRPPTEAQAALDLVRTLLAPYGVRIVDERPPDHLAYTRVMVGGLASALGLDPSLRGFTCVVDCADELRRETVFVFGDAAPDVDQLGRSIAHEAGHAWGLDHGEAPLDLMRPIANASDATFVDACLPLSHTAGDPLCPDVHAQHCPTDQQNTHAELTAALGPAAVDDTPPTITILEPTPDTEVTPGTEVAWLVDVEDDRPGVGHRFVAPELGWSRTAQDGETEVTLQLPEGEHLLRVEAIDQAGNVASAEVTIVAATPEPSSGGCRVAQRPCAAIAIMMLLLLMTARSKQA